MINFKSAQEETKENVIKLLALHDKYLEAKKEFNEFRKKIREKDTYKYNYSIDDLGYDIQKEIELLSYEKWQVHIRKNAHMLDSYAAERLSNSFEPASLGNNKTVALFWESDDVLAEKIKKNQDKLVKNTFDFFKDCQIVKGTQRRNQSITDFPADFRFYTMYNCDDMDYKFSSSVRLTKKVDDLAKAMCIMDGDQADSCTPILDIIQIKLGDKNMSEIIGVPLIYKYFTVTFFKNGNAKIVFTPRGKGVFSKPSKEKEPPKDNVIKLAPKPQKKEMIADIQKQIALLAQRLNQVST